MNAPTTMMQRVIRFVPWLFLLVGGYVYGGTLSSPDENVAGVSPLPVIAAQIGDTWEDVVQHSTFKLGALPTWGGTTITQPHSFVYRDAHHAIRFDNVAYTGVSTSDGTHRIRQIAVGVYRDSAETKETWRRLQDVILRMEHAGWLPKVKQNETNRAAKSEADLRNQYLHLPGGAGGGERFWRDEYGNEAWVRLVKTITGHETEPGQEPRFNLVVDIQLAIELGSMK